METTLETLRLGTRDDVRELKDGEWRLHRRLRGWGVETRLETEGLRSGVDTGDLAAGEWRRH